MSEEILSKPAPAADERIRYGGDPNQFLDLRLPRGRQTAAAALVINIHGGFWRSKYSLEHAGHLCAALTLRGLVSANLEYRRVGDAGGGWPGTFEDVRSAYHFLRQNAGRHGIDSSRVVVMGHSAGGQLALCLAAHEPSVNRVVSLAGVVCLGKAYQLHLSNDAVREFLGGTPKQVPDHYREADPVDLAIPHARQWLLQGLADQIVPPSFSQDYAAAKQRRSPKEQIRLLELAGCDHFDLINPLSPCWPRVETIVLQLLA